MRVTNQMMFSNSRYNYQKTMAGLQKVNQEISSGMKIQNGYENSSIFIDTMRLDYDLTTLQQTVDSTSKAETFASNSDKTLNQMNDILAQVKTKLISAANSGTNSVTSMEAIANDLEGLKRSLMEVSNTSINGQFLFSGTATSRKPIQPDGSYNGNDKLMNAVTGAKVELPYNISGKDLFIGKDGDYSKIVETNVPRYDQTLTDKKEFITAQSTMKQLVGDHDGNTVFYLQGRKPDGQTFREKFTVTSDSKMSDVMKTIGEKYGNSGTNDVVDVSMNKSGQIVVQDNKKGQNILDFNLIAATDTSAAAGASGAADSNDPSGLTTNANVKLTHFIKTDSKDEDGNPLNPFDYDKAQFDKKGKHVTGNVSQVTTKGSNYATNSTKLSEVSGGSLVGQVFTLQTKSVDGTERTTTINLNNPSTFTVTGAGGGTFSVYDKKGSPTQADDVTYRQLNDIISMVTSNELPSANNATAYNQAINDAKNVVEVEMDYRGRIDVLDRNNSTSKIEVSLYNNNAGNFSTPPAVSPSSQLSFSSNSALVVDEPNVDIFKDIDSMIEAVKNEIAYANGDSGFPKNAGIESAIKRLDHLADHVTKQHSKIGSISNALKSSNERAQLLTINVKTIQSNIIDADIGESFLKLNQRMIGYQAILQASSKINSLSLVNYM